ncbi:hypothetical protein [Saccharothrix sp. ALI-22-I]|uniref:hypothetical protein n=1 Tax=Saccharothrix sp. ALI-22-I TaxID=1933778 RepID=UPI00117BC9B4|nr:hypothetical protein [Saccharothrix sp. ALI-22-I]
MTVAKVPPSGLNAIDRTSLPRPIRGSPFWVRVATSQNCTTCAKLPTARVLLSGLNTMRDTLGDRDLLAERLAGVEVPQAYSDAVRHGQHACVGADRDLRPRIVRRQV